ncbi:MAG: hypothetical protein RJB38_2301 [Pseudomonadota bacterium]|jgi:hypothetical protein
MKAMSRIEGLLGFKILFLAALFSAVLLEACGSGASVDLETLGIRDRRMRASEALGERNFARLMAQHFEGTPERQPWAGFWWPYTSNGIAKNLSGSSPAGKYDAARGGLTHAQSWEVRYHGAGVPGVQGWWGHCNGWCVAAALFPEPRQAVSVNGIEFTVADIKGLLSEAGMEASADYFGDRVDSFDRNFSRKWDDPVPNQYFLVLMNYMGIHRRTVLIDRHTGAQVWNQPLAGYRFQRPKPEDYLGEDARAPGVYRLQVTSTIWWMEDNVSPGALSPEFRFETNSMIKSRTLKMELWLDGPVIFNSEGQVVQSGDVVVARDGDFLVGGRWLQDLGTQGHPDYMWVPYSMIKPDPRSQEKHANAYIDIDWLRKHLLSGGLDDDSVQPAPIPPVPEPMPVPSSEPGDTPAPRPVPVPSTVPSGVPSSVPSSAPVPQPAPEPQPQPNPTPAPEPVPTPRPSDGSGVGG